jgi:hypothetical protein
MSNYVYNDEFLTKTGFIVGSDDFHPHHVQLETVIATKADTAGPVTHTGTHTFSDISVSGGTIDGGTW